MEFSFLSSASADGAVLKKFNRKPVTFMIFGCSL